MRVDEVGFRGRGVTWMGDPVRVSHDAGNDHVLAIVDQVLFRGHGVAPMRDPVPVSHTASNEHVARSRRGEAEAARMGTGPRRMKCSSLRIFTVPTIQMVQHPL
jgi:hypothetical protein